MNQAITYLNQSGHGDSALTNGTVTIVSIKNPEGLAGSSDHDTIALDTQHLTSTELAAVIAHELGHVHSNQAAGTDQDASCNPNTSAGLCKHANMYAETAQLLCELSCNLSTGAVHKATMSAAINNANQAKAICTKSGGSCTCNVPNISSCCGV